MKIRRIDHVGIVVQDLAAAMEFFQDLGLESMGKGEVEGEWADRVVGLDDVKVACAMMRTPDGETNIELVQFQHPADEEGIRPRALNALGIRHIAFVVDDIEALVAKLKEKGTRLVGEIQNYQDSYKLCCIHGPEGIILELAEELD